MSEISQSLIPVERIEGRIYLIRGKKVLLDFDLAILYEVEVKHLKRSVKRNLHRFPDDFMFILSKDEFNRLRYQFGTLKRGEHIKYLPMAFTEQGVAMLSSVLHSERAIMINIQIMRTFTKLREMIASHEELRMKLEAMEKTLRRTIQHRFRCPAQNAG
ncbi:MAG: ORF6N domain-containing protein [Patescibacteria group bacterium]|nr:ORF6N domain-containing protein [Patescibacteria group bacterium]